MVSVQPNMSEVLIMVVNSTRSRSVGQVNLGRCIPIALSAALVFLEASIGILRILQGEHALWAVEAADYLLLL